VVDSRTRSKAAIGFAMVLIGACYEGVAKDPGASDGDDGASEGVDDGESEGTSEGGV
jgi:hypothetical protein